MNKEKFTELLNKLDDLLLTTDIHNQRFKSDLQKNLNESITAGQTITAARDIVLSLLDHLDDGSDAPTEVVNKLEKPANLSDEDFIDLGDDDQKVVFEFVKVARKIGLIVVHCSYTRPSQDIGRFQIRKWHMGKGWSDIGYHIVIRRDGTIELGRSMETPGAHARGHNRHSIGICLIGGMSEHEQKPEYNYTAGQMKTLRDVIIALLKVYPDADVLGHRDLPNVNKACPCFDVEKKLTEWGIEDNDHFEET